MELFATETQIIVVANGTSLRINRKSGEYATKDEGVDPDLVNAECLGVVYGYIGKVTFGSGEPRLVFIQKRQVNGRIQGKQLYRISSVLIVPLESESEVLVVPCGRHNSTTSVPNATKKNFTPIVPPSRGTTNSVLQTSADTTSDSNLVRVRCPPALSGKNANTRRNDRSEKVERRVLEEFQKMFTEAESFYYSETYDITNSIQRQADVLVENLPAWRKSDERFFWNIHLVKDMIASNDPSLDAWILPVMQGFIQTESIDANEFDTLGAEMSGSVDVTVFSRRSRYRAGTRYLRRGVDESGNVANYVETEQVVSFNDHTVSYVQVRGSIPVFWTQMGYKYRPPPKLERSDEENSLAFTMHFDREQELYGRVVIVNLVEKNGKEKVLGDAYLNNLLKYDSDKLAYYAFDFHEACGGMRFENVARLINKLSDDLRTMNYCWVDKYGVVLKQQGVCRINCVDCLDRTNVVETHIAKHVLCTQLGKLGLLMPDMGLPSACLQKLQSLWANNGDTISRQYAGTNALKGDFTRTGERKLTGALKDGMNSANRYYLNRFRDASRQSAIDFILGNKASITEDDLDGDKAMNEDKESTLEHLKQMIEDVKKSVVPTFDVILGSWGFVNARSNENDVSDIDTIFILTDNSYFVTEYDCMLDTISETQRVSLSHVESIEIGMEICTQSSPLWSIFQSAARIPNVRINFTQNGDKLFHQFRSSNIRFFNNTVISISTNPDEMLESLKMFADALEAAVGITGNNAPVVYHDLLPSKEPSKNSKTPSVASNWVHKYFSFGNEDAYKATSTAGDAGTTLGPGLGGKTRRSSLISTPSQGDSGIDSVSENVPARKPKIASDDALGGFDQECCAGKQLSVEDVSFNVGSEAKSTRDKTTAESAVSARTPDEKQASAAAFLIKDITMPSCGLLFLHKQNFTASLSTLLRAHQLLPGDNESPITPTLFPEPLKLNLDPISGTQSPSPSNLSPQQPVSRKLLSLHRHSLPVNSLGVEMGPLFDRKRSVTPEITITEEEPAGGTEQSHHLANVLIAQCLDKPLSLSSKRMARSSEDVTHKSKPGFQASLLSGLNSLKGATAAGFQGLSPSSSPENRSNSDIDIYNSVSGMKASHSDNVLRQSGQKANTSPTPKNIVGGLGKFARGMQNIGANYLDPRKLKGSLNKPKLENMRIIGTKKEPPPSQAENAVLQEKVKNCKSRIVDV